MVRGAALLLAAAMVCASASAQTYTTRSLQGQYPSGSEAEISAATTTPNGVEIVGIVGGPAIFPTPTSNVVPMNFPPNGTRGYISAVANTSLGVIEAGQYDRVVGSTTATHAVVWNGTPNSAVDLHIASNTPANGSRAYGVSGTPSGFQATGMIEASGRDAAAMWSGSTLQSSAFTSLKASNMVESGAPVAYSFNGIAKQAGYAEFPSSGQRHPIVWSGTAASYVDLLPAGFFAGQAMCATGESGQELIGGFVRDDAGNKPIIWRGTSGNVQMLSGTPQRPAGFVLSVSSTQATGLIQIANGGSNHAAIWNLATGQVTDLHGFLPSGYLNGQSSALYVDAAGNVYGSATVGGGVPAVPFVWTMVPEPTAAAMTALVAAALCSRPSSRNPRRR